MAGRAEPARRPPSDESRLRALIESIAEAVLVIDEGGRITFASPAAGDLIGGPAEDRIGTSPFELVHPDDVHQVLRSFLETSQRPGVAPPLRFRVVRPDGDVRLVEAVAVNRLEDPALGGVVVTMRDLTDHQQVETALEVSESRFRRMLENISDTVTLVGPDGAVIATTGNVREIMGYPIEFWDGRNGFDLVHPDDVPLVEGLLGELLGRPGAAVEGEFRTRDADGNLLDVEGHAVNLLDDPYVGAIVITTRNITPRKQIERELAAARDAAVRELAIRNEFIASVSHELRTPIHGILGLAELLATAELDGASASLARAISRATESLRMVLDDLLDFTKIEAGRLELVDESVDLVQLLDETCTLYRAQASAKGVEVVVEHAPDLPATVRTDGFRLRQVLTNLVANAVKFTDVGRVEVHAGRVDDPAGLGLVIEVRDTGIGIAAAARERLFEPFSQAYASTAREFGGTGLGLAIARRISELLGGTLTVASEEGRGSTFRLHLPLRPGDATEVHRDPGSVGASRPVPSAAVLVVEDNSVNQLLIRHQLERLGHRPVVVGSGAEALDRFASVCPDVVLMDCQMPGLDGFATTRRLRQLERERTAPSVPVVALTANALPGERARCLEAGMDDYLAKPVGLTDLAAVLDRWIGPTGLRPPVAVAPARSVADRLAELVEDVGDLDVVLTVLRTFRRELAGRRAALERAAGDGDQPGVVAAAHVLRGASAAVGLVDVADALSDLEQAAHDGDPATWRPLLTAALVAVEAGDRELAAWLAATPGSGST